VVKTSRGSEAIDEGVKHAEQHWGREVRDGPPSSEGDAVRPGRGVVGRTNGAQDGIEVGDNDTGGIDPFSVGPEEVVSGASSGIGTRGPNAGPIAVGNGRLAPLVCGRGRVHVEPQGGQPGAGAWKGGGQVLDRALGGRAGWTGRHEQVPRSSEEPLIDPGARLKANQASERRVAGKKGRDGGLILGEPGEEMKKLDVPGDPEGSSSSGDLRATSDLGRGEEGGLVALKGPPGVGPRAWMDPTGGQGSRELLALGDPLRDAREPGQGGVETVKGEGDGEVIGEARAEGRVGAVVRGVVEDGKVSGDEGVREERGGDEEAVETRGTRVGGQGVRGKVKVGEGGVRDLGQRVPGFEASPELGEGGRRRGERTSSVLAVLDEVEITAEEGVDGGVSAEHRTDEGFLGVGLALAGLEVDVEELEGEMRRGPRRIAPKLDVPTEAGRKGDIRRRVVTEKGRRLDDGSAGLVNLEVVEGHRGVRKDGGEGVDLGRSEVSFLEAENIRGGEKIAETGVDDVTPVN
jgi:hypothetical protein